MQKRTSRSGSARRVYIELLTEYAEEFTPKPEAPEDRRAATLSGELIDAGHLTGTPIRDEEDGTRGAVVSGMTVQGRLFLDQLRRDEREASVSARLKKWGLPVLTYSFGVVTPILSEFLKRLLL
jgi:hypothetical protein